MSRRVLLTTGIFPPDIGGPATYVPRLARALSAAGVQVSVITTADDAAARDDGFPYPVERVPRGEWLPLRMARTTARVWARSRAADVVYCNGVHLESALGAAGRRLVTKIVGDYAWELAYNRGLTALDLQAFQGQPVRHRAVAFTRRVLRLVCTRSDRVIVGSRFLRGIVQGWGVDPARITVLPNAVEAGTAAPRVRARAAPDGVLRAFSCGRLLDWKGFDVLIQAAAGEPRLDLTIVGDGPARQRLLARIAGLGVGERVRILPPIPPAQMLRAYGEYDAFLLCSSSETFSYATIEAMASGVPVVVADSGALPEVVDHEETGLVAPFGDAGAWRGAVDRLLSDRALYTRLGEQGYQRARTAYNWDHIFPATRELLFGAAPAGGSRREAVAAHG